MQCNVPSIERRVICKKICRYVWNHNKQEEYALFLHGISDTCYIFICKREMFSSWHVHCNCTLGFLAKISFTPLLYPPGRCLGCPEKRTSSRNYNLFVWSAVFQPKWNDIKKTYKNYQNPVKSYYFLGYYQSLFNFGWITAAQTS